MAVWNGMKLSVEAHRIALQIQALTGVEKLSDTASVEGTLKTLLRQLYVATGGKRGKGAGCYDPTAREFRRIYNGAVSGASLLAANGGPAATEQADYSAPAKAAQGDDAAALLKKLLGAGEVDAESVKAIAMGAVNARVGEVLSSLAGLVADEVSKAVRTIEVQIADLPKVTVDKAHKSFERVLRYAANRKAVLLVGPAGSGKTTLAEQVAKALGLDFYMSGKCADEVKITGYMDGGGTYRGTAFRKAWEFGGVFLFDEMDGWTADALIAVNAPLAGQWGDFPDGMIARHPDFVAIGAANTFGRGADRQYVGREQLDAATLDRFAVIEIDYDEDLELAIASDRKWTEYCQKVRAAINGEKIRHIVSPRASIEGSVMLAAGDARADVEEAYVWKGIDEPTRNRIKAAMR